MFNTLSDHDLERLRAKFILPMIVEQMLSGEEALDDVAEYAINDILFELCPDTALLCLALCSLHIASSTRHLLVSKALSIEAKKIVDEYGTFWLAHEQNPDHFNDDEIASLLVHIPEDLESLRDLLEATLSGLDEEHSIAAILCDILSLQAGDHKDIADLELRSLDLQPQSRPVVAENIENYGDNVIAFPQVCGDRQDSARQ